MGVASVGQSTCPFCGQALSFKGFQTHMKANHPEYVAAEEKWDRDFRKDFGKVALPGVVVWIIAILFLFFATQPVELYFLGLVVAVIVLMGISVIYAHHATAVDIRALKAFHRRCQICGAEVPGGQIADHIRSVHPEERRYLIEARTYALGTLAAVTLLMTYFAILLLPYVHATSSRSFGRALTMGGFFLWTGAMLGWRRFVDSRHIARVRRTWEQSHGILSGSSGPPTHAQ